jgi:ssRNA-specific RNase YbeY (16S rRNA maturation enzyme)
MRYAAELMATMLEHQLWHLAGTDHGTVAERMKTEINELRLLAAVESVW